MTAESELISPGYIENILNQNNSISPEAEHLLLNNL